VIERIEAFYDEVPRVAADVVEDGPFTIFVSKGPWPFYARPRLGHTGDITPADVEQAAGRMRALGVPIAFEWVCDITPSLEPALRAAGLDAHTHPLLIHKRGQVHTSHKGVGSTHPTPGVTARALDAEDPAVADVTGAVETAFGQTGPPAQTAVDFRRATIRDGHAVVVGAFADDGTALGGGTALPRGNVAELVGIGVVPEARRRGTGGLITATLARAAATETVFLTAADAAAARIYERVGFRRHATAGIAAAD
jgi:GNAT superfamily N-acetyltransferase